MQLQKEVLTTKFENNHQQALVNIIYTYGWAAQRIKEVLVPYNLTQQQYNVLRILRGQYPSPSTVNLIKSRILDKTSDTSRIVDRLVDKEYLEKTINGRDKRAVDIVITDKALTLLKRLDKEVNFASLIVPNISEDEAQELNLLLDKLRG